MATVELVAAMSDTFATATSVTAAGVTAVVGFTAAAGLAARSRRADRDTARQLDSMREALGLEDDEPAAEMTPVERRAQRRFDLQMAHYGDAKRQYNAYFYASLIIGVLGFVVIMLGGIAVVAGVASYGALTAAGGLVIEAGAAFVFAQSNRAADQAQSNLREISATAEESDRRETARAYAEKIENVELRNEVFARLALQSASGELDPKAITAKEADGALKSHE